VVEFHAAQVTVYEIKFVILAMEQRKADIHNYSIPGAVILKICFDREGG